MVAPLAELPRVTIPTAESFPAEAGTPETGGAGPHVLSLEAGGEGCCSEPLIFVSDDVGITTIGCFCSSTLCTPSMMVFAKSGLSGNSLWCASDAEAENITVRST